MQTVQKADQKKVRVEKWDILKALLIYLVVLGHICDQMNGDAVFVKRIFFLIYSFHMPLFFFISGLFSKKKIKEKRYAEIASYFALYIVCQLALLLVKVLFFHDGSVQLLNTKDAPWFVFVLFFYYLLTVILQNMDPMHVLIGAVLIGCMAGYDSQIGDMFQLSRMIVFYPFFYLGFLAQEKELRERLNKKWVRLLSLLGLLILMLLIWKGIHRLYWLRPLLTARNQFSKLKYFGTYGGLLRLGYYLAAALIGIMVIAVIPDHSRTGIPAKIGKRTMQIYVLHRPLIAVLFGWVQIKNWMIQIWPAHYNVLMIPLAALMVLVCSWRVLERPLQKMITMKKQ